MPASGEVAARWRVRAGYPLAVLFLLLAQPAPRALALGAAVAVLGLLVRGAAAGHLRKHAGLATSGPYAWTRNPLYFGSALLAAGFAVAVRDALVAVLLAAYFAAFYPAVMRREEAELRARYGEAFAEYAARVPLFWPRPPRGRPSGDRFSWALYRANREYQAALGAAAGLTLLWAKWWWLG
jgi:protein-S-isoprenylcysteine O-methyltransferase Ste14